MQQENELDYSNWLYALELTLNVGDLVMIDKEYTLRVCFKFPASLFVNM